MVDWLRLWHDMPTDPKWRTIARKSGQPLACVIAVFNLVLVNASANAEHRGTLRNWDNDDAAAALDMEPEAVAAIIAAMDGKVIENNSLTGWDKRQPKREDGTAAERKAAWKERQGTQRNAQERNGTQGNAPYTETETEKKEKKESRIVSSETRAPESAGQALDAPPAFPPALPPVDRVLIAANLLDKTLNPRAIEAARRIVERWEASGWSVDLDIIPTVSEQAQRMVTANDPPRSISVFEKWIGAAHAARIGAPKANGDPEEAKLKAMSREERIAYSHRRIAKLKGMNPDTELGIRKLVLAILRNEDTFGVMDRPEDCDTVIPTAWLREHFSDPRTVIQIEAAGIARYDRLATLQQRAKVSLDLEAIREKNAAYAASLTGEEYLDIDENDIPASGEASQAA